MRDLQKSEKIILLQTLYVDDAFYERHAEDVHKSGLLGDNTAWDLVFQGISDYRGHFGRAPDLRLLADDVKARVKALGDPAVLADMKGLWGPFTHNMVAIPEYSAHLVLEAKREVTRDRLLQSLHASDLMSPDSRESVRTMLDELGAGPESFEDFVVPAYHEDYIMQARLGIKKPYHIPWLDDMTGGGGADGDALLMVIPSGGGKTTIALEMAFGCGSEGKHATMLFTEQSPRFDSDINLRQDVLSSGAPRRVWEGLRDAVQDVPPEDLDKVYLKMLEEQLTGMQYSAWQTGKQVWQKQITLLDRVDKPIDNLTPFLSDLGRYWEKLGVEPYIFIVDWLGPLFTSTAASRHMKSEADFRRHVQSTIQELKVFCKNWGSRLVCFHQSTGAAVKPNTSGAPNASSFRAAESTMLPFLFTYAMAATTQFGAGQFWMQADKMRSAQQGKRRLQMVGDLCRVQPVREEVASVIRI